MHPLLTSRNNLLLYLATWIPLGLIFGLLLSKPGGLSWEESASVATPLTVMLASVSLSPWYACRFLPLGATPAWKLLINHLLAAMFAGGLLLVLAKGLVWSLSGVLPRLEQRIDPIYPVIALVAAVMYILSIAFHYAGLAIATSRKAEVLAREAELKALKAQVNPHFLFNSLNSISALTAVDPVKARDMCIRLSDFLRTSLRLGERATISLGEELDLARTYLDVEQVRFGHRLKVVEAIDDNCCGCEVPPLLIQPLVENAIKHGIATLIEGGEIALAARRSEGNMFFVIENQFDPDAPIPSRSGIGLRNVRDRLHTRFGSAARLEIAIDQNRYRVSLSVPCYRVRDLPLQPLGGLEEAHDSYPSR